MARISQNQSIDPAFPFCSVRVAESFHRLLPTPFRRCRTSGQPGLESGKITVLSTETVSNDFPELPGAIEGEEPCEYNETPARERFEFQP